MKSSRKRSAASAFGGSEELAVSAGGSVESEKNPFLAENTDKDVQPTSKLISKIQAVELLATLIQFVPNEYTEAANNAEIGDIKILTQVKLRYLCRRFRNIILRGQPLTLNLRSWDGSRPKLSITDRFGIDISPERADDELSGLINSSLKTLPQSVGSVAIDFDYSNPAADKPNPSIVSALSLYSQTITQPYSLSLILCGSSASAVKCFVKDFGIPFECLFPNVTLDKLSLVESVSSADHLAAERDCLKYFLQFGSQTLVQLCVDFRVLSSAFAPRRGFEQLNFGEDPTNVCVASLPADWACKSLRTLKLYRAVAAPGEVNADDYRNADLRAAAHAEFANLRRWFPNISKLSFEAARPQIDFAVLNDFAGLRKFSLSSTAVPDELRTDSNLVPLANIESFRLESKADLPLNFSVILPTMKKFKLVAHPQYAGVFADLANQVETVDNTFQFLQTFVVKQRRRNRPSQKELPFRDLVRLIRSLDRLPSLVRLKVGRLISQMSEVPPGDLSLVQVLPKKLTHVSFHYQLLPPGATQDFGESPQWSLCSPPNVVLSGDSVYKNWLRVLLFVILDHPSLEHFYCLCVAPQFEAILVLAEKWNKSSVAAIAELGLASVVHIQCTPLYMRMLETRIPERDDRFKFRFVLSPPAEFSAAAGSSTKRKFVTVEFHNPYY